MSVHTENRSLIARRMRWLAVLACLALWLLGLSCGAQAEQAEPAALIITEAQSNNDADWALDFRDYVELFNAGDSALTLSDFFLSRNDEEPTQCHLPAVELAPGEYALLLCGTNLPDLSLPKEGCPLYLFRRDGTLTDSVQLPAMENNVWLRDEGLAQQASPGYPNTAEGAAAYRASFVQTLVISEVVSSNSKLLPLEDEYNDLIELTNTGDAPVALDGYYLSDKKKSPFMWQLPAVELQPGGCYVVQASGSTGGKTAPFKISATGETLYLYDAGGKCVDALLVPALQPDTSYGRSGNALCYFAEPSIGKPNPEGAVGVTETPQASAGSGALSGETLVSLSGEGEIYYTLNGRTPNENSHHYDGTPIAVSENTTLRVRALAPGKLWSPVRTYHYLFDAEKYELPLLCISSAPNTVTGHSGIYENWERRSAEAAINLTLIEDGQEQFSVDCGLKIHGQGSRALKKKSFQVHFRSEYGTGRLEYKLFEDSPITSYNALVLRSGSEDADRAFLRDEFLTSLTAETMPEVLYQRNRPVNLFIDGEYYGIYYIRERVTDSFAASHLGGTEEDIDMVKGWSVQEHGSRDDFMELLKFCRKNDLSIKENYDYVASQICLESFMDYYIARAYTGDRDYPNIRHVRSRGGDGLWRLVNFDIDWGFGSNPACFEAMIGKVSDESSLNTVIINALLQNAEFKDQMLTRLAWHLRNTYAPERVLAHLDEMAGQIAHDMHYNHERWYNDYADWEEHIQFLRDFVSGEDGGRVATMVASAQRAFKLSDEEMTHYFGDLYTAK